MKKNVLLLLLSLLMTVSGFSQAGSTYPKLIVYKGDSVVAITVRQMDYLNSMKISHTELAAKYSYTLRMLDTCRRAIPAYKDIMGMDNDEITLLRGKINLRDKTITDMKSSISYDTRYIGKLKKQKTFISAGAGAVILFLSYLLIK